jgi:hypothetical protein
MRHGVGVHGRAMSHGNVLQICQTRAYDETHWRVTFSRHPMPRVQTLTTPVRGFADLNEADKFHRASHRARQSICTFHLITC